jgi:hypothetical protein
MKGKSLISENLELAYRVWRECGQSPEQTVRKLNSEHDFTVSRQTIYEWMEKYNWKERAARAEAVEQQAKDPQLSGEEKLIAALESQKKRYEAFFETLGPLGIDNQATYAYSSLISTIQGIREKTGSYKAGLFVEFLRELITWLARHDPDSVPAIEKNFDDIVAAAKEKYGIK